MDVEGVNVTANSVIEAARKEYLEIIGRLVHRNALLQAATDTMAAELGELRAKAEAMEELLNTPDAPESEQADSV
jgi:hypothetical protein